MDNFWRREIERSYFPLQNIGLILLEIVPIEDEAAMVGGLRKLYGDPNLSIPLQGMGGILSTEWERELGLVHSNPEQKLPEPFAWLNISISQHFRFCYCLFFECFLKSGLRSMSKEKYSEWAAAANNGESAPPIRAFQLQMEEFLSQFVSGLFLKLNRTPRCPSIRVLLADSIDFSNFDSWLTDHLRFYEYNGLFGIMSRVNSFQVGYQDDRLTGDAGIFAGLNFVCSKADLKHTAGVLEDDVFREASWFFKEKLAEPFIVLYRSVNQIVSVLSQRRDQAERLEKELQGVLIKGRGMLGHLRRSWAGLGPVEDLYDKSIGLLAEFVSYAFSEKENIREMKTVLSHVARPESDPLPIVGRKFDMVGDLFEGATYRLSQENSQLSSIHRRIQAICDQCNQYTNFELQRSMRTLTWAAFTVALVALVVSLWNPLISLWNLVISFLTYAPN